MRSVGPMADEYWLPLPHLDLADSEVPEQKDWPVDGEYVLRVKVRLKTRSAPGSEAQEPMGMRNCYDVIGVEAEGGGGE